MNIFFLSFYSQNISLIWSIWKANDKNFNGTSITVDRLIFTPKVHVWWWFKAKKKSFCFYLDN
jgi:hypothetical protein